MKSEESLKIAKKRRKEQEVVREMILLYCRKNHKNVRAGLKKKELCPECRELADYAVRRSEVCPFMESKTFCSSCPVHCYEPEMREKIRMVMRFSGPRMIFCHPVMAIWHLVTFRILNKAGKQT